MDLAELRQEIEQSRDKSLPQEPFPTPEWPAVDGHLFVRGMTADEGDETELFMANHVGDGDNRVLRIGTKHVRARVGVKGLVDENGSRIYGDSEEDIAKLGDMAMAVVDRLYDRVRDLSGIGPEAAERLEKNSGTTPGSSLPST